MIIGKINLKREKIKDRKKIACILVTKYVIIIEVYYIWNDIIFICILWLDFQLLNF
jgi:hypothetical protein